MYKFVAFLGLSMLKLRSGGGVVIFHHLSTCPDTPFSLLTISQAGVKRGQTRSPSFGSDSKTTGWEENLTGKTGF